MCGCSERRVTAAARIRSEPAACGKKYSVAPFHVWDDRLKKSNGINLIILISSAAQIKNQSVALRAMRVETKSEQSRKK